MLACASQQLKYPSYLVHQPKLTLIPLSKQQIQIMNWNKLYAHINSCPGFMAKEQKISRDAKSSQLKPRQVSKLKIDNFRSHFKILAKNFKNHFARDNSEAYFIRTMRPDINC